MKLQLPQVTLLGIDCVNVERLQAALDASETGIEFGAVKLLTSLPTDDPRLVTIPHIGSIEEYSRFCIEELHKYVDTEYMIMIQYDGFIIHPALWNQEFLEYDYIGGPLSTKTWIPVNGQALPPYIVGNGGFTLRSKKFLELCAKFAADGTIAKQNPEDVAISYWYKKDFEAAGMKYPTPELAMTFSVGENYGEYVNGFGFHGFYVRNMDALKEVFPDYPTHYFIPRIRWARLVLLKKALDGAAIRGAYVVKEQGLEIWLSLKDEMVEPAWNNRMEYFNSMGDIIELSEEGHTASFVISARVGRIPCQIHFQAESIEFPADAKEFLG